MGNNNAIQKGKHKLIDYKIPEIYHQNCHPNLLDFNIDQKEPFILTGFILINSQTQRWRKRVQPLLNTKYILTPCRIITSNYFFQKGCCTSQLSDTIDHLNIAYEPFVYSLSREITSRKEKANYFTEKQLWKIIKYLTKGLIEWHKIFPFQKIQTIMPESIAINFKGNLRIITQNSFPKETYINKARKIYEPPQNKTDSVIKYVNVEPNRFKVLSSDLYAIGVTVIDCLLLQRNEQPAFSSPNDKIFYMQQHYEDRYSRQLKNIIQTLLNEDYKKRPNPHDLVDLAQLNQTQSQ